MTAPYWQRKHIDLCWDALCRAKTQALFGAEDDPTVNQYVAAELTTLAAELEPLIARLVAMRDGPPPEPRSRGVHKELLAVWGEEEAGCAG